MKLQSAHIYALGIPFHDSFSHTTKTRHYSDSIIVGLTAVNGLTGYGEAAPRPYVTGERVETCIEHIITQQLPVISNITLPLMDRGNSPFAHLAEVSSRLL